MTDKKTYTISDLAKASDVTLRTIRYYVSEGLLPSPQGTSRGAIYTQEHFDRLTLIKILKEEYLPLQEIKTLLEGLSHKEVQALLLEKQKSEAPPPLTQNSAKDYLETLLQAPASNQSMMRHKVEAIQQPKLGASIDTKKVRQKASPKLLAEEVVEDTQSSIWQRIELSPEVELHVKGETPNQQLQAKIKRLIQVAHQILSSIIS